MQRSFIRFLGSRTVRRHQPGRWRWPLERLEDRTVPAGNVIAAMAGATLTLIGDDLSNTVQVLPGSATNEVVVQGSGTTVNGSSAPQVFTGVENLVAHLLDGNDRLTVQDVSISAPSFSQVFVDGNAGNDVIEIIDTTIQAVNSIDLQIFGERVIGGFASGTSGNDSISVINSNFLSNAFVSVKIYGETNEGGVVTGGNDTITIADSIISASGGFFHSVALEIVGDSNSSLGGQTSTIGGGNDKIAVRNTTIAAASDAFSGGNAVSVSIVGDFNSANGFDPITFTGANATATIGGGNDSIDVTDTTISVSGVSFGTSQNGVMIAGDRNFVSGFPGASVAGAIGGGNDKITVADSSISAVGGQFGNGTFTEIRGEDIQVIGDANTSSTIGGGNDKITARNITITADGPFGDAAALTIWGDFVTAFGDVVNSIGGGNDVVTVQNVQIPSTAFEDFGLLMVDTGLGNDRVDITDSSARFFTVHLGDGDDVLNFNTNVVGEEASLDGGPGFDRLNAHGNTGLLIWFGFEDVNVTP